MMRAFGTPSAGLARSESSQGFLCTMLIAFHGPRDLAPACISRITLHRPSNYSLFSASKAHRAVLREVFSQRSQNALRPLLLPICNQLIPSLPPGLSLNVTSLRTSPFLDLTVLGPSRSGTESAVYVSKAVRTWGQVCSTHWALCMNEAGKAPSPRGNVLPRGRWHVLPELSPQE